MLDEIGRVEVMNEVETAFANYNRAIEEGDGAALNGFFWQSPETVRFGPREHLFGYDEISTFRTGEWRRGPPRTVEKIVVNVLSRDAAATSAIFRGIDGKITRQSQVWSRQPEGWRIVAAHVSGLPDTN